MLDLLARRIWANDKFQLEKQILLSAHLRRAVLKESMEPPKQDSLIRLLRSAAVMAGSSEQAHRSAAYKIAVAAASMLGEIEPSAADVLLLVLYRLGNFPSAQFAIRRYSVDASTFSAALAVESQLHMEDNSVNFGGDTVYLTDFQTSLWTTLNSQDHISISAPTSAGKSFVIQSYLRNGFHERSIRRAAYIVPSRALVNQVATDVSAWISTISDGAPELFTIPFTAETPVPDRAIFVMTQERFQLIQSSHDSLTVDVIVADEIQGIGDGARGILLSSVIEEALHRQPEARLLFAGPNLANPAHVGNVFGANVRAVKTAEPTVSQNLFLVRTSDVASSEALPPDTLSIATVQPDSPALPLGSLTLSHPITRDLDKLIHIPTALAGGEQSLVYVNGPAMAENVAFGIADATEPAESSELAALSKLAAEAVHPEFQLVETVKSGVGFHYGRLPALVRQSLEKNFGDGHLRYLVTTSTLLQGVNLPAKNLFMYKPTRGPVDPITSIDFWNLAGRAGRLGKEFEGNVFLIDYPLWESSPLDGTKEEVISSSLEKDIIQDPSRIVEYISNTTPSPDRAKTDDLENTFVKLYLDFKLGRLPQTLQRIGIEAEDKRALALTSALSKASSAVSLDTETVALSPTVSVYRQQALFERLVNSVRKRGVEYVIPKHPQSSDGYNSLVAIFKRCHDEIFNLPKTGRGHVYFAVLAHRWMKGETIPQIVDASLAYRRKKGEKPSMPTVIREVLKEIEQDLRFKYVRATACYINILKLVLREEGRDDLTKAIPSLPLYMEVGAVNQTMISLMGIGVSRFTAGKLQSIMARTDLSQSGVRTWLRGRNVRGLNIPAACADELIAMGLV